MKVIYNPAVFNGKRNFAKVRDLFQQAIYEQEPNTIVAYENDSLADYLLKKYGFLQEVKIVDVDKFKKRVEKDANLEEVVEEEVVLSEKEQELINGIPKASASAVLKISKKSGSGVVRQSVDELPVSGADADGVEWSGAGIEDDLPNGMIEAKVPGVSRGVFGAA